MSLISTIEGWWRFEEGFQLGDEYAPLETHIGFFNSTYIPYCDDGEQPVSMWLVPSEDESDRAIMTDYPTSVKLPKEIIDGNWAIFRVDGATLTTYTSLYTKFYPVDLTDSSQVTIERYARDEAFIPQWNEARILPDFDVPGLGVFKWRPVRKLYSLVTRDGLEVCCYEENPAVLLSRAEDFRARFAELSSAMEEYLYGYDAPFDLNVREIVAVVLKEKIFTVYYGFPQHVTDHQIQISINLDGVIHGSDIC